MAECFFIYIKLLGNVIEKFGEKCDFSSRISLVHLLDMGGMKAQFTKIEFR